MSFILRVNHKKFKNLNEIILLRTRIWLLTKFVCLYNQINLDIHIHVRIRIRFLDFKIKILFGYSG